MMPRVHYIVFGMARLGFALAVLATAACGTASSRLTPSASVTTLTAGWEQRFRLDWTAEPETGDARRIRGYISNHYGQYVEPVRVLAQALDQSGVVIGQRIESVPGGVAGLGRSYFEVRHLPVAARYAVSIWDYSVRRPQG